jgi:hypothetical protein
MFAQAKHILTQVRDNENRDFAQGMGLAPGMRFCTQNGVIRNVHQYGNRGREKLVLVRHARKNRDSFQNQRLAAGSGSPPGAEGMYSSVTPKRTTILSGISG